MALAVEGRDFVRRCIELCHGDAEWQRLCRARRSRLQRTGEWSPEREDYTWLETAFCGDFLKNLRSFGGMDHEWRTGPKPEQGGFWVLVWAKDPQKLWWELREELDRQAELAIHPRVFPLVNRPTLPKPPRVAGHSAEAPRSRLGYQDGNLRLDAD